MKVSDLPTWTPTASEVLLARWKGVVIGKERHKRKGEDRRRDWVPASHSPYESHRTGRIQTLISFVSVEK